MILVLGGTTEGRRLAEALREAEVTHVLSLAGRTTVEPGPGVRVGGFGGVAGLVDHLRAERVAGVIDATHPFASQMHRNAYEACAEAEVPLLRLEREGWEAHPLAPSWTWVATHEEALAECAQHKTVLLTVGRQEAPEYDEHPGRVIVRVAEAPDEWRESIPAHWEVLVARGPFHPLEERRLLRRCDVMVSKDSGGAFNEAKLHAAHEVGVPVVMIRRPDMPASPVCTGVTEAVEWAKHQSKPNPAT